MKLIKGLTNIYENGCRRCDSAKYSIFCTKSFLQWRISKDFSVSVYSTNRTTQERPPEHLSTCTLLLAVRQATRIVVEVATVLAATAITVQELPAHRRAHRHLFHHRIQRTFTLLPRLLHIIIHLYQRALLPRRRWIICIILLRLARIPRRRRTHLWDWPSNSCCCMLRTLLRASKPLHLIVRLHKR